MKKRNRRGLIVLAVIMAIVIAVSVVLRLVLSREKLIALIVPRIEKAVDADISIGDIGIRFPFGFGVNVTDLSFEKKLPDAGDLHVFSEKTSVSVSLMSLIRKRPDIEKIDVDNATVRFSGTGEEFGLELGGVSGRFSMQPGDSLNLISADMKIGKVTLKTVQKGGGFRIEDVAITAGIETSLDFNAIEISEAAIRIGEIISADMEAKIGDLAGEKPFSFNMVSSGIDLVKLIEWAGSTGFLAQTDPIEGKAAAAPLPAKISSGTLAVSAAGRGSLLKPSEVAIEGKAVITGLEGTHVATGMPFKVDGEIRFAGDELSSDALAIKSGGSSIKSSLKVKLGPDRKPVRADIISDLMIDLGELAAAVPQKDGVRIAGKVEGKVALGGSPSTLRALFPGAMGDLTPPMIKTAWNDVTLDGRLALKGGSFKVEGDPLTISESFVEFGIKGSSIESIKGSWQTGKRPWTVTGSMKNIFPCLSEMMLLAQAEQAKTDKKPPGNASSIMKPGAAGELLDSIHNRPVVSLDLKGRCFDARPFQKKPAAGEKGKDSGDPVALKGGQGTEAEASAAGAAPLLLNTVFTGSIDTLITEKAVFTSVRTKGKINNGKIHASSLEILYAGGSGTGTADIDLRDAPRIKSLFNVDFKGIQAEKALAGVHSMGSLVRGVFSFKAAGDLLSGPGIDPLKFISVSGNASSTSGTVDLTSFITPLTEVVAIDLSRLQKVDLRSWTGNYYIKNGRLGTEDWKIASSGGNWNIKGSFGFDGTLDYRAHLVIPPAAQKDMKDLQKYKDLVDLFRDEGGNLVLDLDVGGSAKSPKVYLDQTAAKAKAGQKLMDNLKEGAADKLKDLFKKKK